RQGLHRVGTAGTDGRGGRRLHDPRRTEGGAPDGYPTRRAGPHLLRVSDRAVRSGPPQPRRSSQGHASESAVVRCVTPANVDTVIIDGRIVKQGGKLLHVDVDQVVRNAEESARNILKRSRQAR